MKIVKRLIVFITGIVVLVILSSLIYLNSTKPDYSGTLNLANLEDSVVVYFDEWGIPHIYAQNELDAYRALGFLHAQERLFQMEMMKRVAYGRLSEILGADLIETDKFFLALGMEEIVEKSMKINHNSGELFAKASQAYLDGINDYIKNGSTPVEYTILGIPKEEFSVRDMYMIAGYMAFSFSVGFTVDPIVSGIDKNLGSQYLKNWGINYHPGTEQIHSDNNRNRNPQNEMISYLSEIKRSLPVPIWTGSNSWVISPSKSQSGKVIFSNDTHIGYSQPSVFYEAHLEYPGYRLYGNFLAGIPFAMLGHNQHCAWGLTMFENDDLDMFREKSNPDNPNQVWFVDHWEDLRTKKFSIKVKGAENVDFELKISRHGPVMNSLLSKLDSTEAPISVWWSFSNIETRVAEAFYKLNHANNLKDAGEAASIVYSPGLNVMYGDSAGNIAWWAAAKLVKRPAHVNSNLILDGAGGKDEYLGFYDFDENPKSINPDCGFVYSANNQPDTMAGILYPGYYAPEFRAKRIVELLSTSKKWTIDEMKKMITDEVSDIHPEMAKLILSLIDKDEIIKKGGNIEKSYMLLLDWQGGHEAGAIEPTIYYKLLYNVLFKTFADELGETKFDAISSGHLMGNTYPFIFKDDSSCWWDDISTKGIETRKDIFSSAFYKSIEDLEKQSGEDMSQWKWSKVHLLEHPHPIGTVKPFDRFFNVGPFGVGGGNQTINNIDFDLKKEGIYKATYGPSERILLDFADLENSISVLPTGESGNFMSKHYDDQAEMYVRGEFRKQMMNKKEIVSSYSGKLVFVPVNK